MLNLLILTVTTLLSFKAYSHTHYCDHAHNQDGSVTYFCDNYRYVAVETCSGINRNGAPLRAILREKFDGSNRTGSWQWQIQAGNDLWEFTVWAPDGNVYRREPRVLAVYYPPQYSGRFSHTGTANYLGERKGQTVRLQGSVKPNLSDRPMPRIFDFLMACRPIQ